MAGKGWFWRSSGFPDSIRLKNSSNEILRLRWFCFVVILSPVLLGSTLAETSTCHLVGASDKTSVHPSELYGKCYSFSLKKSQFRPGHEGRCMESHLGVKPASAWSFTTTSIPCHVNYELFPPPLKIFLWSRLRWKPQGLSHCTAPHSTPGGLFSRWNCWKIKHVWPLERRRNSSLYLKPRGGEPWLVASCRDEPGRPGVLFPWTPLVWGKAPLKTLSSSAPWKRFPPETAGVLALS